MKVSILTEGTKQTGFGHITRCVSVYQAFQHHGNDPSMIINGERMDIRGVNMDNLSFFNWLLEKEQLFNTIENNDITIIDSYLAPKVIYQEISSRVRLPVYIDDNARLAFPPGVIVNGSINADQLFYSKTEDQIYLLGTDYQPMRKAFWKIPERTGNSELKELLITLGATDLRNLTPGIVQSVCQRFPALRKHVVVGADSEYLNKIRGHADDQTSFYFQVDDKKMHQLMMQSDLAISAAGQTIYELAVTGIPAIIIGTAKNQINNIKGWIDSGFIKFAGWWYEEKAKENIQNFIDYFLQNNHLLFLHSAAGKSHMDPGSTINLVNKLLQLNPDLK